MDPSEVLIIKPGSMGDVVHALPVASAIHSAWPNTKISWIVDPRWMPILDGNPAISRLIPFPRQAFRGLGGVAKFWAWLRGLRELSPDIAIDLQGLLRSGLMAKFSSARSVIGLDDAREFSSAFHNSQAKTHPEQHAVTRYLQCLPQLGISIPTKIEFTFPKVNQAQFDHCQYIVIHPFARGAGKSLKSEEILAMAAEFAFMANKMIVIVGQGTLPSVDGVVDLTGRTTLLELMGILRGASFVVSVDSGPMHIAAGMGVPLLGIHTWSDPRLVGPYNERAWIWQGGEIRRQNLSQSPRTERKFALEDARRVAHFVIGQLG